MEENQSLEKVKDRLGLFIQSFVSRMEQKLVEDYYYLEHKDIRKEGRLHKIICLGGQGLGMLFGAGGAFLSGFPTMVSAASSIGGAIGYETTDAVYKNITDKARRENLCALYEILKNFVEKRKEYPTRKDWMSSIVKLGCSIFQSYEMQMMTAESNNCQNAASAQDVLQELANDAVDRILSYAAADKHKELTAKGVFYGTSKQRMIKLLNLMQKGNRIKFKGEICTTDELYGTVGWFTLDSRGIREYYDKNSGPSKFGYRCTFKTEKVEILQRAYKKNKAPHNILANYKYLLDDNVLEALHPKLLDDLEKGDPSFTVQRLDVNVTKIVKMMTDGIVAKNENDERFENNFQKIFDKLKEIEKKTNMVNTVENSATFILEKIETARKRLKACYKKLEYIDFCWQKHGINQHLQMDIFYNKNIIIVDNKQKLKVNVTNFEDLFSNRKRIIIMAGAGYGKSTFVHEMARRWAKDEMKFFELVFLVRLSDISQSKTISLQSILTAYLKYEDSIIVSKWLDDFENMEKCLFIFDGFDEQQQVFGEEIDEIIFGKKANPAYVVVTSRAWSVEACKKLEEKFEDVKCENHFIKLKGYTETGVTEQLRNFNIDLTIVGNDLRAALKVPLFNTLFCLTHEKATIRVQSICTAIEQFVKSACKRHSERNLNFTPEEENKIIMKLGQAAQNKFSFMKGVNIGKPDVTMQQVTTAIDIGLLTKKSTITDFVFAHETIAEYCAAIFWTRTFCLCAGYIVNGEKLYYQQVHFATPRGGSLKYTESFSCFLSYLDIRYKNFLWKHFELYVPLLNDFNGLEEHTLKKNKLWFEFVSIVNQNTVLDKIKFSTKTTENDPLMLHYISFEYGNHFKDMSQMKHLYLSHCSFKISLERSRSFHIKHLELHECTFNDLSPVEEDLKLEHLTISRCDITVVNFLAIIMRHCKTLKTFQLLELFESNMKTEKMFKNEEIHRFNSFGEGWISELQQNVFLLRSIEHFELDYCTDDPADLRNLFETLEKMVNLQKLVLTVRERHLTKEEIDSLRSSYRNVLQNLGENFSFDLKDEDGNELKFKK